jgi:hypothetical protein
MTCYKFSSYHFCQCLDCGLLGCDSVKMGTVVSEEHDVSNHRVKVIRFTLQPDDTVDDYIHPSCIIVPHPQPVNFDTENGGDNCTEVLVLLPKNIHHSAENTSWGLAILSTFVLKMELTYPSETLVFASKSIRCHKSYSYNVRSSFFCFISLCSLYT